MTGLCQVNHYLKFYTSNLHIIIGVISQYIHRLFVGCKAQEWADLWWIIRCVTCDHLTSAINWWSPCTVCVWMLWLICFKCTRDVSSWQIEDFRFKCIWGQRLRINYQFNKSTEYLITCSMSSLFYYNYSIMWAAWTPQA